MCINTIIVIRASVPIALCMHAAPAEYEVKFRRISTKVVRDGYAYVYVNKFNCKNIFGQAVY
jgi:hypothetical protein